MGENIDNGRPSSTTNSPEDDGADDHPPIRPSLRENYSNDDDNTIARTFDPETRTTSSVTTGSSSFTYTDYNEALNGVPLHARDIEVVASLLESSPTKGLSDEEAKERLGVFGENIFKADGGPTAWKILVKQMANAMTLILIATMALSFGVKDFIEGGVIVAIILTNIIVGFIQEFKAEKTMASLRSLASPNATVIRSSQIQTIPASQVVPGDLIMINSGGSVPADARLVWTNNLEIDEAILTGESLPVAKVTESIADENGELGAGDRINLVFASTNCTKGRGRALVIATGMDTQMGQIAAAISANGAPDKTRGFVSRTWNATLHWLGIRGGTPLQQKMAQLAYILLGIAILLAIVVFAAASFKINDQVVLYAVALGIGVIPESLIAVLTITFALGTKRMAARNVIVRKLDALEALGGVTDICSDKTGTITQGKMVVREVWASALADDGHYDVETAGAAIELHGKISKVGTEVVANPEKDAPVDGPLKDLLMATSLCNVATIDKADDGSYITRGDPTEIALQVLAHKAHLPRVSLVNPVIDTDDDENPTKSGTPARYTPSNLRFTVAAEYTFDSSVKRMTMVYKDSTPLDTEKPYLFFMKGAVERVLDGCTTYASKDSMLPLDDAVKASIVEKMNQLAVKGLRVIAFATRSAAAEDVVSPKDKTFSLKREEAEQGMNFIGLSGIYDPPRLESLPAVRACKAASIRVRMLTGDHPSTAAAIAREVEIVTDGDLKSNPNAVMTASEFDKLTDEEVDRLPDLPLVVARCTPETKVRMLEAGKRRGYYMAMTGDGVNDAPALSRAAVGVAMGLGGSDVAKGAADLVLMDDNFGSIVAAVEEGRRTYDNIQRFIVALIVGNVSEVLLLMIGLAFIDGDGHSVFPLSPLAILWINLVTASPPALGLGFEPAGPDVMLRPPHDLGRGVFTWEVIIDTFFYGFVSGVSCLLSFVIVVYGAGGGDLGEGCNESLALCPRHVTNARSVIFTLLTFHLLFICWQMKSLRRSIFNLTIENPWYKDLWHNQVLFWSVILGMAIVPLCLYVPVFNTKVFRHTGLGWEWGVVVGMAILYLVAIELWKLVMHRLGGYAWFGRQLKFVKKTENSTVQDEVVYHEKKGEV